MCMKKKGFTLAEMMVVMLIISICLAAFAPLITRRAKADMKGGGAELWKEIVNNSGIYYNPQPEQSVVIGRTTKDTGDKARLIINKPSTGGGNYRQIVFSEMNDNGTGGGKGELYLDTTSQNINLGSQTKYSATTSGYENTSMGIAALYNNTNGNYNTAVGYYALFANSTSNGNTAIGAAAGKAITTGSNNTAIRMYRKFSRRRLQRIVMAI
jgi:prepilin-type N-terminal cleavage/methylation domain-containing protein